MLPFNHLTSFRKLALFISLTLTLMNTVVGQIITITPTIPEYRVLLKRGLAKAESGDYKRAIEDFDAAIRLNPQHAEAYYHRGMVRSQVPWIHAEKTAVEDFEMALKINPRFAEAWIELGRIKGDLNYFDVAIKLNPELARAYYWRGYVRAKLPKSFQTSIQDYQKAISINPKYVDAYLGSARAHIKLKEYGPAIDDLTRAIQLSPQHAEAYEERGLARLEFGDESGALDDFVQIIKLAKTRAAITAPPSPRAILKRTGRYISRLNRFKECPALAKAYYQEGLAYWHVGKNTELALESLTRAIQLNLNTADVFYQRGLLFLELQQLTEAIQDLTLAIQLKSADPDYFYSRGRALFQTRDYAKAAADLTESIRLSPRFADAHYWRGRANYNLGDKEQAISNFSVAIKVDPGLIAAYYWRGIALEETGRVLQANDDYVKVVENRPLENDDDPVSLEWKRSSRQVHYNRGRARLSLASAVVLDEVDDTEEAGFYLRQAVADFSFVIAANPIAPEAHFWRARAQKILGQNTLAVNDLNKVILLRPGFVNAYLERAPLSSSAQAGKDLNDVIGLKPTWAKAYYERGAYYFWTDGKTQSVISDLTRAIELDPTFAEAYSLRADLRQGQLNDHKGALEDYTQVIRLNPDDLSAHKERALLRLELKDYQGVIDDTTRTIELASGARRSSDIGIRQMYAIRSRARYETGDGIGSYEDKQRADELSIICPTCSLSSDLAKAKKADALLQKGLSLSLRGDTSGARLNFEEAARLYHAAGKMPQYQNARYQLSNLQR